MKKDTNSDLFWIDIEGLSPGQIETYQYWVYDQSPASGSPKEENCDPYSTLVLSLLMILGFLKIPIQIYQIIQLVNREKLLFYKLISKNTIGK